MEIGDLVRHRSDASCRIDDVGIVLEVNHAKTEMPDYRTPTSVLVFYGRLHKDGRKVKQEIWFDKNELEIIT